MKQLLLNGTGRTMVCVLAFAILVLSQTAHLQTDQPANKLPGPAIMLNVLVLDDSKRAVDDVSKNEFHVFEDNVEQQISFFSKEQVPISYGLMIDNSGSLRSQLKEVVDAGKRVVTAITPEDEAFVMRFVDNKNIDIVQDFTSNKSVLERSLSQLYPEGGQTALIDALFVAAMHMSKRIQGESSQPRRHALILVSDGEDRQSTSKARELFDFLYKSDIQIYVIGLVSELDNDRGPFGKKPTRGESIDLLNRLARETGGQAFFPKSHEDFSRIVSDIIRNSRTQYMIGYTPLPNARSKTFRSIKVKIERDEVAEKRTVITRAGYAVSSK